MGTLFFVAYLSRGTLPKKGKRALLGDLVGEGDSSARGLIQSEFPLLKSVRVDGECDSSASL